jgi:hypothetical protein
VSAAAPPPPAAGGPKAAVLARAAHADRSNDVQFAAVVDRVIGWSRPARAAHPNGGKVRE